MQHDSLYSVACFSDCCWKDTHEACGCWWPRTRQTGVFFLLGRRPSCSSFDVVVFYSQSSYQVFFEKEHTHANVFKTWNSLPSAGLDFRKEKHHQRTQDRLPDLLRQNLFFFSWFRLGVGWLSISLFRLRRSFTRRSDMVWHSPPHTSWWSLRLLLGRLLLRRRFRWCLCLHHVLSDDSQIFARHNLKQMLSFAARSVRLIACSWMHMWTVWHYHNLIAAISMRLINCMCLCTWVWTTSDQLTQPTLASQSSKMPRSARQAAWFKFFDKIRTSQTIFNGSVFPTNIAAGHLKVSAWHIFFFEPNLDSNSTRPGR